MRPSSSDFWPFSGLLVYSAFKIFLSWASDERGSRRRTSANVGLDLLLEGVPSVVDDLGLDGELVHEDGVHGLDMVPRP